MRNPYPTLRIALGIGGLLAVALSVLCVRTYFYIDAVLVPQEAERAVNRQADEVASALRRAGASDAATLEGVVEQILQEETNEVFWMRILDMDQNIVAQSGKPQGKPQMMIRRGPLDLQSDSGTLVETPEGQAYVKVVPLRMPRPHLPAPEEKGLPTGRHPGIYSIEVAVPVTVVSATYADLRQNLVIGIIASIALFAAVIAFGLGLPLYFRGRHLEGELQLAKQVQSYLQPQSRFLSGSVQFATAAVAADQVGGDFHDIFETGDGKVVIVLGDVAGKGISAALLASVLQGAIRSASAQNHELACEQINKMLCERTACERFATLFWGVYDPESSILRYVNAGHGAPILRRGAGRIERLDQGGPVIGVLPMARYSAGSVEIGKTDKLVLYSDGIDEAANENDEEFGDARLREAISAPGGATPRALCEQIMNAVTEFAAAELPRDDRTLMVIRFSETTNIHEPIYSQPLQFEAAAA